MLVGVKKPLQGIESKVNLNHNVLKREASKEYFMKDPLSNLLHQNQ